MSHAFKTEEELALELKKARTLVKVGGSYAHYKHPQDATYTVIDVGFIENTEEVCVIYKNLNTGFSWVRTLIDFNSSVEVGGYTTRRFTLLNK